MRRCLLMLILTCFGIKLFANVYDELPFTFERLTTDFNGVVINNYITMVYGNGSIILKTDDFGYSWKQICIAHDSFNIKKIVTFDGFFYGIMNKEIAFRIDPSGSNLELFNLGLNETLTSISLIGKEIYILKQNEISVYDQHFKKIRFISLSPDFNYREMINLSDFLFISTNKGILLKISTKESNNIEVINFSELNIAQDSSILYSLKTYNMDLFVTIEKKIYKSVDLGKSWNIASNFAGVFNIYDGNLFLLNTFYYNNTYINFPVFKKVINNEELIKISIDTVERYTSLLIFNGFEFITKEIIIAYGMDKLISMSYDGGKTWKLISNLPVFGNIYKWLNDEVCYVISSKQFRGGQVFTTSNKGITWLPQKLTDTSIFRSFNSGTSSSIPGIFYADENGRIFLVYGNKYLDTKNMLISKDYGNTFESVSSNELRLVLNSLNGQIQQIIKKENEYLMFFPSLQEKNYNTKRILLDSNFKILDIITLDSITIIASKYDYQDSKLVAIGRERKGYNGYSFEIERNFVMTSFDFGKNWLIDFEFPLIENLYFEPYFLNNLILVPTYINIDTNQKFNYAYDLNILDLENKLYKEKAFRTETRFRGFSVLNDKLLWFMGNDTIYIYDSLKYFPHTSKKYLTNNYIFGITDGNLDFCYGTSSKKEKPQNSIITNFKFKKNSGVLVEQSDLIYFYYYPPYPNPAHNQVHISINWDKKNDLDIENLEIYNYLGKKVYNDGDMRFEFSGDNSGFLIWDCGKVPTGIYFIYPKIGNARYFIPVVIKH
ncbi:MAG: hypothetical protein N2319_03245 [Candidatus Kapabacteria bacterium]|nr:hypothetical protein [Candidatus Kapabacteria bacterium]